MRYLKKYEIFESSQIWDLEDICQDIKDEGFDFLIRSRSGKSPDVLSEIKLEIFNDDTRESKKNFMIVDSMRDFLFRIRDWSIDEGYDMWVRGKSSYQVDTLLQFMEDGSIMAHKSTCTPKYPSFSMLEIFFDSKEGKKKRKRK